MFTTFRRLPLALAAITLSLIACDDDKDPDPAPVDPCLSRVTEVSATISTPTTWSACGVYVVGSEVRVTSVLTIEPGAVVKFKPGAGLQLVDNGRLQAVGTAALPIVFTSWRDDVRRDTNQDGTASAPARKDWARINLNGTDGSQLAYCRFLYGGQGGNTLEVPLGTASITYCTFAHNGDDTAVMTTAALDAHYAEAGTVIQHNVFYDNVRPLSVTSSFDLDDSNTFQNPANATQKNTYQGIVAYWDNNVTKPNLSWAETELAFVNTHEVDLRAAHTLRLGDGVTLKFLEDVGVTLRESAAQLLNATGAGVSFTSFKDDTRGGDSNGNGAANAPATGDWEGIYVDDVNGDYLPLPNRYYATH